MSKYRLAKYAVVCFWVAVSVGTAGAIDWTSRYVDDFDANVAESDSYAHSLFWWKEVTPLPQPYLFYLDTDKGRGLAFVDYQGQLAELSYAFSLPASQTQRTVIGTIEVEVSFPSNLYISQHSPGQMSYRVSPNGMTWSDPVQLTAGLQQISVACAEGTCYVRFSGTRAVIEHFAMQQSSPGATIYVPGNYPTIQDAIDAARNGDVIEVAKGTYSGPRNRDIDFRGRLLTVRSAAGPQATIIDCSGGRRGFYFHSSENANALLSGFTIQAGQAGSDVPSSLPPVATGPTLPIGGGIYCEFSSPTIANCIIKTCQAGIGGGIGIAEGQPTIIGCTVTGCTAVRGAGIGLLAQSSATITDCVIESNAGTGTAAYGGGIYCWESDIAVSGSRIASNRATGTMTGGGAYCAGRSTAALFQNSLVVSNSAKVGPGLFMEPSNTSMPSSVGSGATPCYVNIVNCTIALNTLTSGGTGGGVACSNGASVSINSSIIWGNGGTPVSPASGLPISYSDIEGGYIGIGTAGNTNINQDPKFVSTSDFHLQSQRGHYVSLSGLWVNDPCTSPCIDTGDPNVSATGEPAPNGERINMGAYGGSPQASKGGSHTIYHVATDGWDYSTGLSRDYAFKTIKKAVGAAQSGDTILVWPGIYTLSSSDEIIFDRRAITIQSAMDAAVIAGAQGYAFSFYSDEGSKSVLSNFVIKGCVEGAIFCYGASPTLNNLTIVRNGTGVVIGSGGGTPTINSCIFWGNNFTDLSQDLTGTCYPSYSHMQQSYAYNGRQHNITSDPQFADPNGDYHLKSYYGRYVPSPSTWVATDTVNSPCIDAGDPSGDYRAEPKPDGGRINMGAYGGTPYASKSKDDGP